MASSNIEVVKKTVEISFEDIYPVWKNFLWPKRKSPIEKTSAMKWRGGYNMDYLNRPAFFFSIQKEDKNLIGVLSCFPTEKEEFRMRGLWVHPEFRGRGLGKILVNRVIHCAEMAGAKKIWSLPRINYKQLYIKFGFSNFVGPTNEFEFGPHYYAMMNLDFPLKKT